MFGGWCDDGTCRPKEDRRDSDCLRGREGGKCESEDVKDLGVFPSGTCLRAIPVAEMNIERI